jgi:hypothetical protein
MTPSPGEYLREVFAICDRDRWPALIAWARGHQPPITYRELRKATGYSKTQLWRIVRRHLNR